MFRRFILIGSVGILVSTGLAGCGEDRSAVVEYEFEGYTIAEELKLEVKRVIDGDTIVLEDERHVRYIGIDTPEKGETFYEEAREANRRFVEGKYVKIELDVEEEDRYGRTLAYVYVDGIFVNAELVRQGYARVYSCPPNVKYEHIFLDAEQQAKLECIGIWGRRPQIWGIEIAEIIFDPPGNDRENLNGEWVKIIDTFGAPVDMNGFTLRDEANHVYRFLDFALPAWGEVRVFTGSGVDRADSLYWNSGAPIWNNTGDTAYLKDDEGFLIDEFAYGEREN